MNGEDKEPKICSFCGRSSDEVENMVTGPGVYICSECIDICHNILLEERKNKAKQGKEPADTKVPTPEEIKEYRPVRHRAGQCQDRSGRRRVQSLQTPLFQRRR